ncbi:MAG TPA: hypothetical protein VGN49_11125 [Micrococcaceae bacterium]|jgi:hypothetical protein|nr:hypothetical protein [Micrococcaceae bacterium]
MSDHSSQPSNDNAQEESAEWQGTAAPADGGRHFAETVDRKLESPGAGDRRDEDPAPALEEDQTSVVRPENS